MSLTDRIRKQRECACREKGTHKTWCPDRPVRFQIAKALTPALGGTN